MKKILIILLVFVFLTSCSEQSNMSNDIFFERLGTEYIFENKIVNENEVICFYKNFVLRSENNDNGDIVSISITCDDANKKSEFLGFAREIIAIFASDEDYDDILNSFVNENILSTKETEWYTYQYFQNEHGIFLSVNNNKINPQTLPEYSLKSNENTENKKRIDEKSSMR